MISFILRHPFSSFLALLLHAILFMLILISAKTDDVITVKLVDGNELTQTIKNPQMKTFAVDSKQVEIQIARLEKQEQQKLVAQKQLKLQTEEERKRLALIKRNQKTEQLKLEEEEKRTKLAQEKTSKEKWKAKEAKRLAEIEKKKQIAQKKQTELEEKKAKKAKLEAKLAMKKQQEAKKNSALAEEKRRKSEEKAKAIALEIKKRNLEKKELEKAAKLARLKKEQAEEEAYMQEQLAAEAEKERRISKARDLKDLKMVYISNIASVVRSNWKTSARISDKAACTISITQTSQGEVASVKVHSCNQYATRLFKKDAERAVYRSQPLPKAPVKELFEPYINFKFKP